MKTTTTTRRTAGPSSCLPPLLILALFIIGAFVLLIIRSVIGTTNNVSGSSSFFDPRRGSNKQQQQQHRIAILIPFVGNGPESIPPYLNIFCATAEGSASLVDFLLIHNGALSSYKHPVPENVKLIDVGSTRALAQLLLRVTDRTAPEDLALSLHDDDEDVSNNNNNNHQHQQHPNLLTMTTKQLDRYPYVLVEYKPALGHIFADYLQGYSHWGYSDLDVAFGDLPQWITPDELDNYDIVTYGYGDQNRAYLRGQFTFHKNDKQKINQLWRDCKYLSEIDKRWMRYIKGEENIKFESAEGCYSSSVLQHDDLRIKYAVKAFTDADEAKGSSATNMHGLFLRKEKTTNNNKNGGGSGRHGSRHRTIVYLSGNEESGRDALQQFPIASYESAIVENQSSSSSGGALQWEVGPREEIPRGNANNHKCMFWVQKKYQANICISDDVEAEDTVFFINGRLYKQRYETMTLPGNVRTVPFFHFQEWKRHFRVSQVATVQTSNNNNNNILEWALTKEGAIPLSSSTQHLPSDNDALSWPSVSSPLGLDLAQWKGATDDVDRRQLPKWSYCLRSTPKKNPLSSTCQQAVHWQNEDAVEIIHSAPLWNKYGAVRMELDVTLALTLQISSAQASNKREMNSMLDLALASMRSWGNQPCVLVIHVSGATETAAEVIADRLATTTTTDNNGSLLHDDSNFNLDACLVAAIFQKERESVSRNALLNMAMDVAPTRWVVMGLEVERGVVLSKEASFLSRRKAEVYSDIPGHAFIIPEVAVNSRVRALEDPPSLATILKTDGKQQLPFEAMRDMFHNVVEEKNHDGDYLGHVSKLWQSQTWHDFVSKQDAVQDTSPASLTEISKALNGLQLSIVELLMSAALLSMEMSPIVMVDNIGPRKELRTIELVREVEEFGGSGCFDGLRIAQLATFGYQFNVLPGAFSTTSALSNLAPCGDPKESWKTACPLPRGCFLIEKEEKLIKAIAEEEISRPAMAAILWNELRSYPY